MPVQVCNIENTFRLTVTKKAQEGSAKIEAIATIDIGSLMGLGRHDDSIDRT
jgi:hypothetical protein